MKTVDTLLVVGLGLIGGSFAAAVKLAGACRQVYGYDLNRTSLEEAQALGIIDYGCESLAEGVMAADLIMLAIPMLAMKPVLEQLSLSFAGLPAELPVQKVVTDAGSSKKALLDAALEVFGGVPTWLVPGHPIAGSEKSGVGAAKATLFQAHDVILTPLENTNALALEKVKLLWEACGAVVTRMDPCHHDEVLAKTSHLPHFLAFSLVDTLAGNPDNQDIFRFAAGGFRDFTRIAGSDPIMWHDVALGNDQAVLQALDQFTEGLQVLRQAIVQKDSQSLLGVFSRAQSARQHFSSLLESRKQRVKSLPESVMVCNGFSGSVLVEDEDTKQDAMGSMKESTQTFIARPGGSISGDLRVPGDKSISHRSIMLGALAEGETVIEGFLEGEDALATLKAFRDMGVQIDGPYQGKVTIQGVGMYGLKRPEGPMYLGNAGTAMRLMAGLMAAQSFDVTLTGDHSLSGRPMNRVVDPLRQMGAIIETAEGGRPPLKISGGARLKGIEYHLPMASAQVQSCLLLAGMFAEGETVTVTPGIVRDHTNRMLEGFGYPLSCAEIISGENGSDIATDIATDITTIVALKGGGKLTATRIDVPSDVSSAAFFMVAASIAEASELRLSHVGMNPTRSGVIEILQLMGADITLENESVVGGEPVADLVVRSAQLKGIDIPERLVPIAIDEFPVLFIAAACAEGRTLLTGARELRVKESDRIQAMADGLIALGIDAQPLPDGMMINGSGDSLSEQRVKPVFNGGTIDSHGDHRIAMSFAVAALRAKDDIRILDCANVATSFPDFAGLANRAGMRIVVKGKCQ
ncbi:bifunctional prephenate dehydrogenase/3-phosphoshikimate 1-carboxyvinyltransferase [Endozoicomonas sp. SCSIO W0465]|uniref:bifunctional prephenate dehydrogenase/3-phosphoshikimate 1-carboxyvinyltransferase n=1 Tax=Endozoicomonas sp. SCSIO W0465 TaxID=2918516 RepID=UPI002074F18D|nr:bifunctional prephenate dehydrogenase/3-phosphoshikimate 1-carboxyvinyltransferase [Endozoicomonas sp. SCSIO W0465]USE39100.1 bifunctional prephenate dehydrogenase/3-phosphoshikimate 1-carboxyvinyltransferase [Endozoicomonas sp. SCSIO W0465]